MNNGSYTNAKPWTDWISLPPRSGVATLAGRKSILRLAQRMSQSFCQAIGASSFHTWTKVPGKTGEDIRVASRKNLNDPGEPLGVILCAVSSVLLPVSPHVLFDFLRDETHRHEVRSCRNLSDAPFQDQWMLLSCITSFFCPETFKQRNCRQSRPYFIKKTFRKF